MIKTRKVCEVCVLNASHTTMLIITGVHCDARLGVGWTQTLHTGTLRWTGNSLHSAVCSFTADVLGTQIELLRRSRFQSSIVRVLELPPPCYGPPSAASSLTLGTSLGKRRCRVYVCQASCDHVHEKRVCACTRVSPHVCHLTPLHLENAALAS